MKRKLIPIVLIAMVLSLTSCNNSEVKINNSNDSSKNNEINISNDSSSDKINTNNNNLQENENKNTSDNKTGEKTVDTNNEVKEEQQDKVKDEVNNLLGQINEEAKQGRVINCKYMAGEENIISVFDEFGEIKGNYVSEAKGIYYSFDDRNLAFGVNKGGTIFEVRTFEPDLKKITLNDAVNYFGNPDYDVTTELDERIIGYVINDDIKLLLVFGNVSGSDNPSLDHYSCLAPSHTANSMLADPGREW